MLSAEWLRELPLDVRVLIANMDIEAYIRMYLYDTEFRVYAINAVDEFIEQFVVRRKYNYTTYIINDIKYFKYVDGSEYWWKGDVRHRSDGPAVVYPSGEMHWYVNNKLHRTDGPAIIYADGTKEYWVNDKQHRSDDQL